MAYKADIDDLRESPALRIIKQLDALGAVVDYHDPFVPELPELGRHSIDFHKGAGISAYDAVVIVTAHTGDRLRRGRREVAAGGRLPQRHGRRVDVAGKVWKL